MNEERLNGMSVSMTQPSVDKLFENVYGLEDEVKMKFDLPDCSVREWFVKLWELYPLS